jgi:teichoic acid transport system permease protein
VTAVPAPTSDLARLAAESGLPRLGGQPGLLEYTRQLWARRHFCWQLAMSRFRSQNEQDRLGVAWVVLRPLLNAGVYGFIFGFLLTSGSRPKNFLASLVVGVFVFQFFSGSFNDGARSIAGNLGLVRTLHFPRAVLPLATIIEQLLGLFFRVIVMLVVVVSTHEPVRLEWLRIIPAFGLMTMFCAGLALMTARLTIHVRDVAQLLPFISRVIFYLSGIFYSVPKGGGTGNKLLARLLEFNPVHTYIALVRGQLIHGEAAPPGTWRIGIIFAFSFLVVGYVFFWRAEERYGRE